MLRVTVELVDKESKVQCSFEESNLSEEGTHSQYDLAMLFGFVANAVNAHLIDQLDADSFRDTICQYASENTFLHEPCEENEKDTIE